MIECVQGNAGCLPAEDGYPVCVRDLSTKYNVLLIADEIQAGLGRAGYLVSNQKSGIKPDMDLRKVTLRRYVPNFGGSWNERSHGPWS